MCPRFTTFKQCRSPSTTTSAPPTFGSPFILDLLASRQALDPSDLRPRCAAECDAIGSQPPKPLDCAQAPVGRLLEPDMDLLLSYMTRRYPVFV
jgi:hypothetical protein